jgi:sortase (surface protein transpeptidase)
MSPVPRAAPASIDIDKIGAHSTLIPRGLLPNGALDVPDVAHPQQAAWYCDQPQLVNPAINCKSGVLPGQAGPAIVVGHVDGSPTATGGAHQQGVFYRLHELEIGDLITVKLVDGTVLTYAVYKVLKKAKTEFAASVTIGSDTNVSELRLVTCGGKWVGGRLGYEDNIIVFAARIPNQPT